HLEGEKLHLAVRSPFRAGRWVHFTGTGFWEFGRVRRKLPKLAIVSVALTDRDCQSMKTSMEMGFGKMTTIEPSSEIRIQILFSDFRTISPFGTLVCLFSSTGVTEMRFLI